MSRVFQVNWLVAKCEEYFVSYLDKLDSESSYSDMLFVVEEAVYLMSAIKCRDFLDLVVGKIDTVSLACRNNFVQSYLSDLSKSSSVKIDACLAILKSDADIIVEVLISHLEKQENKSLDENTRHLLWNVDLIACGRNNPKVHEQLFDLLAIVQCVQREDFQLFLGLTRQNTIQLQQPVSDEQNKHLLHRYSSSSKSTGQTIPEINSDSVNFQVFSYSRDFQKSVTLYAVVENLALNHDIPDLYTYIDGLWIRLYQGTGDESFTFLPEINSVRQRRGWDALNFQYVERLTSDRDTKKLLDPLKSSGNENLVSKATEWNKAIVCSFLPAGDFVEQFFLKDSVFKFEVSSPKFEKQEFLLRTSASRNNNPGTYSMKYYSVVNSKKRNSAQTIPKLHFMLETDSYGGKQHFPISWCGKPTCDVTKTYWNWGYIRFHNKSIKDLEMISESGGQLSLAQYVDVSKCHSRLVAYVIPIQDSQISQG